MIFVVEQPAPGLAHAWFAFDAADFLRKACGGVPPSVVDASDVAALLDAGLIALADRVGACRVYGNEETALAAADAPDALFDAPQGWRARRALREQLVALEVLADDL